MRHEEVIEKFTDRSNLPFICESSGDVYSKEETLGIGQIGMMLFQTLESLGLDGIDVLEIVGDKRTVVMRLSADRIIGNISGDKLDTDETLKLLEDIERDLGAEAEAVVEEEAAEVETEAVAVKEEVSVDLKGLSENINMILTEFLGDFAARVYRNQLKVLKMEETEVPMKRAKELIYALGNAASLMIGPTQSQEMTDRLLMLIK
ncbi:MAG TPA: hypothetical protein EYP58_01955 [bacterium (Candidatus Stahlbacteria)]|nr:hypothetical protein [Candidatus Stahlbacteria bacterium]